jgi:hypothetical protein
MVTGRTASLIQLGHKDIIRRHVDEWSEYITRIARRTQIPESNGDPVHSILPCATVRIFL